MPRMFVARADLDGEIVAAFRDGLPAANQLPVADDIADRRKVADNLEWDNMFPGAIFVNDSDFNDLRDAMRKAALFDGLRDPFGPDANTPPLPQEK